jgi:hypothetical protein
MMSWALKLSHQLHDSILIHSYPLARDCSLQIHSILDILISLPSSSSKMNNLLLICLESFKSISHSLAHLQSQFICPPPKEGTTGPPPAAAATATSSSLRLINFSNIIGSDDAKQILYENVILPLSLPETLRLQLFQGIRSSGGNVLLFGPPGTGSFFQSFFQSLQFLSSFTLSLLLPPTSVVHSVFERENLSSSSDCDGIISKIVFNSTIRSVE